MSIQSFSAAPESNHGGDGGFSRPAQKTNLRELLESIVEKVDGSELLKRIGQALAQATGKVIKPGKTKDVVSGTWLGHPAHPMLTDLPIGFWTSSFLLDFLGGEKAGPASDALVALGVAAALPAAISGLSDLADVSEEEGLRIGTAHALGNTAALLCYSLSLVARKKGNRGAGIAWSSAGAGLATAGGYLGGHMAYRRGIGVNQTAFAGLIEEWTAAIPESELKEGKAHKATVDGEEVFLLRDGDRVFGIANRCSHRGGPLNEGEVTDGEVTCPWHLSTFRLADGAVSRGPATAPQPCYEARIRGGQVEVRSRH